MKLKALYITIFFLLVSMTSFAQYVQTEPGQPEKFKAEIGLDMSVPDFNTKTIDAKVMGARLAGIIEYLINNYNQAVYSRKICQILKEQVLPLEKQEFSVKKLRFMRSIKSGDEITILFTVWPSKKTANVQKTDLKFRFNDGVSESQAINELFSMMSRYVQRKEQLRQ